MSRNAGTELPPGPRLPRTLQTLRWLVDGPRFMADCQRRYGDIFTLDLIPYAVSGPAAGRDSGRWVLLSDPEHIKQVFRADPAVALAGETNMFLLPVVGSESILVLDEPRHMEQRKLILPPFHGKRVERYEQLISQVTVREIECWPEGKPFALWPRMQSITLEVIVRAVFGIIEPQQLARFHRLLTRLLNGLTSPPFLFRQGVRAALQGQLSDLAQLPAVRRLLDPVDDAVFEEVTRRRASADLADREDILSALMHARREGGTVLTDQQLRDELITLLVAGHESTATMLAWAFERLLRYPEALARLREEAGAGEHAYADAVVRETLRLRPVVPIVLRKLVAPLRLGDHELPAGTWLAPCAYLVHRNAEVYPEPHQFRPERFLDKLPGAYAWTPFGGGARRCVGASFAQLEMRVVLQTVLSRVDLRATTSSPERIRRRFITLVPSRGARVLVAGPAGQPPVGVSRGLPRRGGVPG